MVVVLLKSLTVNLVKEEQIRYVVHKCGGILSAVHQGADIYGKWEALKIRDIYA